MGSSSLSKKLIFDEIRNCYVRATPEEMVRQHWVQKMIRQLGYPRELIVVEKAIGELPHLVGSEAPDRRLDILCYGKGAQSLFPLLLIECKDEPLTEGAVNQVIGYNYHVKAHFIAAAGQGEVRFGHFDEMEKKYVFASFLPLFRELMEWVKL
jgi:hypothetical protein